MNAIATILHISDLHFGWEGGDASQKGEREVSLNGLLSELSKLDVQWKPSIVCLTGDVGWSGAESNYTEAKGWLDRLIECCSLDYQRLVVCPGNHDVFRQVARKVARPTTPEEADEVLAAPPIEEQYMRPFSAYTEFCKTIGLPPSQLGTYASYLVGERGLDELRFVVLNSAWFAKGDDDEGKLWVGLPHLRYLEAHGQLPLLEFDGKGPVTMALMHHPPDWLRTEERHVSGTRPNTVDYLARRCHVLLTGHTHGEVRFADRIAEGALHFTGGAAYARISHFNSFRLFQVSQQEIVHRSFEFDPRSAGGQWRSSEASSLSLVSEKQNNQTTSIIAEPRPLSELRAALRNNAIKVSEQKSRLLRPVGRLPLNVAREVSVRVNTQRQRFDPEGRLVRIERAEQTMPFYEAIRRSRRTLLLGDLGTGKSTLGAQLVVDTIDRSQTAVAAFVPAKELQLKDRFTTYQLLESISDYLTQQVIPSGSPTDVRSLLESKTEVLLVIDGLDELPQDVGSRMVWQAATMPEHWPTIQIVATARPIELGGVSYPDWRLAYTIPLDDDTKQKFIAEEMMADGVDACEVDDKANVLLRSLKEMPALDSIANSPLAIRLIYPRLRDSLSRESLTVGDLLYELLLERLGGWQKRDDKPATFDHFDAVVPTSEGKVEFLAVLARKAVANQRITVDEAKADLRDAAADIKDANKDRLADEALACFEWLGLIARGNVIEFPLRPLVEVSAAAGLLARWRSQTRDWTLPDHAQWRVVYLSLPSLVGEVGWRNCASPFCTSSTRYYSTLGMCRPRATWSSKHLTRCARRKRLRCFRGSVFAH